MRWKALVNIGENEFLKQWGMLEDVYADALDRGVDDIPIGHVILVNTAIEKLKKLINQMT